MSLSNSFHDKVQLCSQGWAEAVTVAQLLSFCATETSFEEGQ